MARNYLKRICPYCMVQYILSVYPGGFGACTKRECKAQALDASMDWSDHERTPMFRMGGNMPGRRTVPQQTPKNRSQIEVPVQRLAEYVPASFTAAGENETDPLNMEGARWYKTGDEAITLVLGDDQQSFALEFNMHSLCALSKRAESMSNTDIDEVLGL